MRCDVATTLNGLIDAVLAGGVQERLNTAMSTMLADSDRDIAAAARAVHEAFKRQVRLGISPMHNFTKYMHIYMDGGHAP
jgi:hypothetical protein